MKIAIVTGSSPGGCGFYTARDLVLQGYKVHIACRNQERAQAATKEIESARTQAIESNGDGNNIEEVGEIICDEILLDLASYDSVKKYAEYILNDAEILEFGLSAIVCNAGTGIYPGRGKRASVDKLDHVFQVNFLGHALLLRLILPRLLAYYQKTAERAKIVMLSSVMHRLADGKIDNLITPVEKPSEYRGDKNSYKNSKLCCHILAQELQKRYTKELRCVAVNPGAVNTEIWRNEGTTFRSLVSWIFLTPEQGAKTSVQGVIGSDDQVPDGCYLTPYFVPHFLGWAALPFDIVSLFWGSRTGPAAPLSNDPELSQKVWELYESVEA